MDPQFASAIILSLILLATTFMFMRGLRKLVWENFPAEKLIFSKSLGVLVAWIILTGILARLEVFVSNELPPRPMLAMLTALVSLLIFAFSATGKKIIRITPVHWLIFFQSFRILVELWFWYGYRQDVFPQLMSFEGANHDIYAGLLAIVAGTILIRFPSYARATGIAYNLAGILLLANTLKAAVTSFPSPIQQYAFDERLGLLAQFPFIYLPAVLVPLALGIHIISISQLLKWKPAPSRAVSTQ